MSSSTEYAYARLEAIVHEQEAARARLETLACDDSAQRAHVLATIASLDREYEQLYLALDAYADVESRLGALIAAMPGA